MFGLLKNLISSEKLNIELLLDSGAVVIDVRTVQEFASGAPKGSINIPLSKIEASIDRIKKYNKPIITCCVSGRRSGLAAGQLQKFGIEAHNGGSWKTVSNAIHKNTLSIQNG